VNLYADAQEEALRRLEALASANAAPATAAAPAARRALPRATRKASAGGTLSGRVQPGEENIRRGLELMSAEDDYTAASNFARQRAEQGEYSMLTALAAGVAGGRFAPLQGAFLKRALAAQDPLNVGTATIGPDGTVLRDPSAERMRKADRFFRLGEFEQTLADRQQAREDAAAARADNRALRLSLARMQGGGEVGAGPAPQIGSTPEGAPIFRSSRQGMLFTYDQNGQPTPYSGPLLPKISAAQPTEDERKAAGWFAQADNARRNMANTLARDSTASAPTFKESALSKVPVWGEEFANSARPENRQMFVQAASSMAEALLRAATGAGINESEARQKANELVPILGDKPGVIQQKLESYDVYMASLRTRANRALPALETALQDIYSNRGQADDDGVIDVPYP
jgi:hypothetical protein